MRNFSHLLPHRALTSMGHLEKRFYANRLAISTNALSIFDVVTTIQAEAEDVIGLPCPFRALPIRLIQS
jgi:hypothetical protein